VKRVEGDLGLWDRHADRHQAIQALLVQLLGHDALNDLPDRVPGDPQKAGNRGLCHLLGKPRDHVLEVACVGCAGPGLRHRLQVNAAVCAAQAPELALDHAPVASEIQMPPALQAPVVDMQALTGLAAARADPSPPAKGDGHDHPLSTKADIDDGRSRQSEHPLECGLDAHAVLLCGG
jgi:hypothetical protein